MTLASIFANLVAVFIIIATGATLYVHGDHTVDSAADAAKALEPFAGRFAELLFAIGLLGASLLAAAILPVTAAYVIAETFGLEKGIARRPREAPVFVTTLTVLAAGRRGGGDDPGPARVQAAGVRPGPERRAPAGDALLRLAARRATRS